ncbi:MAG: redoxin protein, partial [Flavipsychrobacter sp.]|nr:redoxin protein [Flavipsychrobacter sp.]
TKAAVVDTLSPFQKFPTLPAFNIRMMDSVTIFNTYNIPKGKKTLIVFFSPDCKHCQRQVKELTTGMDSISDIQLYMITPVHSMTELKEFYDKYHLGKYKNIQLVGRDYEFFFGGFYGTKVVPDMVLYDEQKKLIKLFEGNHTVTNIYEYSHGKRD